MIAVEDTTDVVAMADRVRAARTALEAAVKVRMVAHQALSLADKECSRARDQFREATNALLCAAGGELPIDLWSWTQDS